MELLENQCQTPTTARAKPINNNAKFILFCFRYFLRKVITDGNFTFFYECAA
jgi:hypothetical protein